MGRSREFAGLLVSVPWCVGADASTLEVTVHDGDGWLLAYLFDYDEHWRCAVEALEIDTTLAPRAMLGLPTQALERTLQLQIVYSL